jgi:hypothetical protein
VVTTRDELIAQHTTRWGFRKRGPFEGPQQYIDAVIAFLQTRDWAASFEVRLGKPQREWTAADVEAFHQHLKIGVIYPTRHCFDDAVEFCERRARQQHPSVTTTLRLVHGIILVPEDHPVDADLRPGEQTAHAWVEDGDVVWDAGLLADGRRVEFSVAKAEYYAHYRVQATTAYTMGAVLIENRASGHCGPWRPEYRALCKKPQ